MNTLSDSSTKEVLCNVANSTLNKLPKEKQSTITKIISFLPLLLFKVVSFITISISIFFYRILTCSFTLHLNFTSLLVILGVILTITYLVVRYRLLTTYSRLKPINKLPKVASSFDLHPDTVDDDYSDYSKSGGYKNYPDEFLSAFLSSIKIFGYLEQPVFHELARHLQTKKLLAGDTLFDSPEQERSFYIVVDGHVQMFVKPDKINEDDDDSSNNSDFEEDQSWSESSDDFMGPSSHKKHDKFKNYTLINEVGAGGTLSSLFTILSIFRESFNRSESKGKQRQKSVSSINRIYPNRLGSMNTASVPEMKRQVSSEDWNQVFPKWDDPSIHPSSRLEFNSSIRRRSKTAQIQSPLNNLDESRTVEEQNMIDKVFQSTDGVNMTSPLRKYSDLQHPYQLPSQQHPSSLPSKPYYNKEISQSRSYRSVHPNIVARATVDTTLVVIPEEAFHKLTQKFPKAAAHIIQVIVTRFQRVTLMTSHRYLGLTSELLKIEKQVIESADLKKLPSDFFAPGLMERLRRKFKEEDNPSQENNTNSSLSQIGRGDSTGIIQAMDIVDMPTTPSINSHNSPFDIKSIPLQSSNANGGPTSIHHNLSRMEEYSTDDDERLRTSVMHEISNTLGIRTKDAVTVSNSNELGGEKSPRYMSPRVSRRSLHYPMDLFSHTGSMDSNASPSLNTLQDPYDDDDIDARSTTSAQSNSDIFSNHSNASTGSISPDDIQILYFPKDAILVKEGSHNNGLIFVIDGLLEVSMTPSGNEGTFSDINQSPKPKKKTRLPLHRQNSRITENGFKSTLSGLSKNKSSTTHTPGEGNKSNSTSSKSDSVLASEAPAGRTYKDSVSEDDQGKNKKPLFIIKPGNVAGYLNALTGFPSFVEIKAKTDTYVGYVSKKRLDRIVDKNPSVMLKLAHQLVGHVSPLILHIDVSLEWMQVGAGQIIYREGEPSDNIYMVLHGRLRTIHEKKEGQIEILGEFGHGDSVGELEVLTGISTTSTLHAIRDTELARMPKTLFNALALRHPEITLQISRMVALRSLKSAHYNISGSTGGSEINNLNIKSNASSAFPSVSHNSRGSIYPELYGRNNVNLKTIGIIPVNSSVPIVEFAERLKSELIDSVGATCALLNGATVTSIMGKYAFSRLGKLKMASWLADQEEKYRIILYLADSGVTSQWTRTCIRQADCILLVGLGEGDPSVGEYERFLISMKTTARKELVLLHGERFCKSGTTQNWLKNRLWIQAHHHIFMPMKQHATFAATENFRPPWLAEQGRKMTSGSLNMLTHMKDHLKEYYAVVPSFSRLLDVKKTTSTSLNGTGSLTRNDFSRLARRLCGKSVALVLGGGGARGISHVGIIQAIEEAGIPIDIIGGTSIGSFVGGLYARNMDLVSVIARTKFFAGRVSSVWRQVMDLTYPVTAWFTGHEFNRAIWKCIGDSQIEDYWLPFYAVTTNITFSKMDVHTTGYAWRYIRASMSLSGYMPPICDNGNMLVDGGYMDNLPVTVAKNMGADIIIAVDVASEDDTSPVYYGDSISGWWALLHGFNPLRTYNVPSIADIQSRLAYVSSVPKLEEAKVTDGTLYLKLPVQQWGTLEFSKYNDIFQKGYDVGREVVGRWKKAGYVSGRIQDTDINSQLAGKEVKGKRGRRNSV